MHVLLPSTLHSGMAAVRCCRDSLSAYRASLLLATCLAILGVDFHAFPRRFAKAETFGTGLMDAGVGSFVVASGISHGLAAAARSATLADRRQSSAWRKDGGRVLVLVALGEPAAHCIEMLLQR